MKTIVRKLASIILSLTIFAALFASVNAANIQTYKLTVKSGQIFLNGKQIMKDKYSQIESAEWLSDSRIGALMHVNPSLGIFETYDAASGKYIDSFYGYSFIYNRSKTNILYIQAPPHFSSIKGEYSIMLNHTELYKTDTKTAIDNSLYPTQDFKRIAFYEYNVNDESRCNIVIFTMDKNKGKTKNKIVWNKPKYELRWKNGNILSIGNAGEYDMIKSKLLIKAS